MVGPSSHIRSVDEELAASAPAFLDLAGKRANLLREKLAAVVAALESLSGERKQLQDELQALLALIQSTQGVTPAGESHTVTANVVPEDFSRMTTWAAAREVLRTRGHEMFTAEITARLVAGGRRLPEKSRVAQVNSSMSDKETVFYSRKVKSKSKWGLLEWTTGKKTGD